MYVDTMSGHEDNHEELKSQIVEIVALNPDVFNSWVWSGSVQDHVNKMRQLKTWTTQIELAVTASPSDQVTIPGHASSRTLWNALDIQT